MKGLTHSALLQAIDFHANRTPAKVAVFTVEGEPVVYAALLKNIQRAAAFLSAKGIGKGDKILLSAQKEVEFVYFYFASHLIGAINVVVDAKNSQEHIDYIASVVKPKLSIGVDTDSCESLLYPEAILPDDILEEEERRISEADAADIMFTSGTTGNPKGVILSHYNIYSSASNINSFIGNSADDIELLGLPICHSFGLGRLRCNMLLGSTVVLHNGFANIKSVFDSFEKYKVTGFGMVPAIWAYIRKFSGARIGKYASQIRYMEIGSAAMPLPDKEALIELFPDTRICMHYGLTEASRALFMEFHESRYNLDSVGVPVSDEVDVKIMDSYGNVLAAEEEGEVCIKGNMVTKSYYLPDDNKNAFFDEYFRTGDWGRMSEDGKLFLVARKKELINVGGKKISPVEIEDALTEIGVGESMCIAAKDPDGILGEVPKVLLVKGTFSMSVEEMKDKLRLKIEAYKMPKIFEVVDSIPKTESGKKKRTAFSK